MLENIEPAGTDLEPVEQPVEPNDVSPDAVDLDNVAPSNIDSDPINLDSPDTTDAPEIDRVPDVLENSGPEDTGPEDSDINRDGVTFE
ncbi:MAG: hypothetical protein AAFQ76_17370, partial [Cyanobacteria bacterium J06626_26]